MSVDARRVRIVLLALPLLGAALTGQRTSELVLSVGHTGAPMHAVFVGRYLATESWSNVNVMDLESGLTVARLYQGALVEAMDSSRSGDLLAVGTCGRAVNVWNVKSRTRVRRFAIDNERANAVAVSPDGAFVASSADGNDSAKGVQVWDLRTGTLARELIASSVVHHLRFSGDGRWLAAVDDTGKATVFGWPSARVLQTFDGLARPGWSDTFALASRDGRYLAWLESAGLRLFEIDSGREVSLPGARPVRIAGTLPDGTDTEQTEQRVGATAAAFLDDGRLAYVDGLADGEHLNLLTLPGGQQDVRRIAWPRLEVVGDGDVVIEHRPSWLTISHDGRLLAGTGDISDVNDTRTVIWDVARARLRELTAPALVSPESLQWSRTGLIVWAGSGTGARGWNDHAGKPVRFGKARESSRALGLSSDGRRLVTSGSAVRLLDVTSGRELASRDQSISASDTAVAASADGLRFAFAPSEVVFGLFDSRFKMERRLEPFDANSRVEHTGFSPDGKWIAAGIGGPRQMLRVWSVLDRETSVTLDDRSTTYGPQPPAFSADSRRLASFVRGTTLTIWSTGSWAVERTWTLSDTGQELAFAPDGARLAIAQEGEAAIWDADTGNKLVTFSSPGSSQMTQIAWSADGKRVVTAADDGVLRFWSASDGLLIASLYILEASGDWLLIAPDGRLDGSERALARFVGWRVGERVSRDRSWTRRHRVRDLWRSLFR